MVAFRGCFACRNWADRRRSKVRFFILKDIGTGFDVCAFDCPSRNLREPSFSPDGREVAFTWHEDIDSKSHVYVKLIGTGGPPMQLTNGPGWDGNPVWSPAGRLIAFLRALPEKSAVLVIPALGGPERKIAEARLGSVPGPYLNWSPDGNFSVIEKYLAGMHAVASKSDLFRLRGSKVTDRGSARMLPMPLVPSALAPAIAGPGLNQHRLGFAFSQLEA